MDLLLQSNQRPEADQSRGWNLHSDPEEQEKNKLTPVEMLQAFFVTTETGCNIVKKK